MRDGRVVVDGVWKKFRTGERFDSLRDLVPALARRLVHGRPDPAQLARGDFWALQDVSFDVRSGQALGVIGHNGAGKSTLLKLLTRILRPTRGRILVTGRVGALIEVAAGFHPDLTGRENVFLQGAIMGMAREDIRRRFEEIVEFSGVSDFIDTPVKRYSSGMNARLGFAIAAHLEPDVLIIDEVLSVGDLAFQTRAFGRMREVVGSGIPVVVVSHQLERITELCTEAILLRRGQVVARGAPVDCVRAYVAAETSGAASAECRAGPFRLEPLRVAGGARVASGDRARVHLTGDLDPGAPPGRYGVGMRVRRMESGQVVFATISQQHGWAFERSGPFELVMDLQLNLFPGLYALETWVNEGRQDVALGDGPSVHLEVTEGPAFRGVAQLNPILTLGVPAAAP